MNINLGFISSALAGKSLAYIAAWGHSRDYAYMEVGPHAPLQELKDYLSNDPELPVRALLYCRNIRHPDAAQREEFLRNTQARIDIARDYNVSIVSISTGIDPSKSLSANVTGSAEVLQRLCDRAEGVTVAVENCPDTGNIAVNPEVWAALLEAVDRPNFRLTYDPSHLVRLGIEPYEPIYEFGPYIAHVHAKDTEVIHAKLARQGFLGEGWWRYRVPGWGDVDWKAVLTRLVEVGFSGGISLEHEDPLFGGHHDGSMDSVEGAVSGLEAGASHLRPLLKQIRGGEV